MCEQSGTPISRGLGDRGRWSEFRCSPAAGPRSPRSPAEERRGSPAGSPNRVRDRRYCTGILVGSAPRGRRSLYADGSLLLLHCATGRCPWLPNPLGRGVLGGAFSQTCFGGSVPTCRQVRSGSPSLSLRGCSVLGEGLCGPRGRCSSCPASDTGPRCRLVA